MCFSNAKKILNITHHLLFFAIHRIHDGDRDVKLSPKKHILQKCLTPSQSKVPRKLSPSAKRSYTQTRSPTNSKRLSSPLNSPPNTPISSPFVESPAIQTAKRLKRFIDADGEAPVKPIRVRPSLYPEQVPHALDDNVASTSMAGVERLKDETPPDNRRDGSDVDDVDDDDDANKPAKETCVWTRAEDRLLLEQIQSGVNAETEVTQKICDRFPDRRKEDIVARIGFLLDFLNKLRHKS